MQFTITITGEKNELADGLAILKAVMGDQVGGGSVTAKVDKSKTNRANKTVDPPAEDESNESNDVEQVEIAGADLGEIPSDVDLRAKASTISAANRPKIKALLTEYGVANLTAVPDEQRIEFMERLNAL